MNSKRSASRILPPGHFRSRHCRVRLLRFRVLRCAATIPAFVAFPHSLDTGGTGPSPKFVNSQQLLGRGSAQEVELLRNNNGN